MHAAPPRGILVKVDDVQHGALAKHVGLAVQVTDIFVIGEDARLVFGDALKRDLTHDCLPGSGYRRPAAGRATRGAKRAREAGPDSRPTAEKKATAGAAARVGREEGRVQNGGSSDPKSSVCTGAPPAGIASPFAGAWASAAAAPLPCGLS